MDEQTERYLITIYRNNLTTEDLNALINHISIFLDVNQGVIDVPPIRLKNYTRRYFSVFHQLRTKSPVLFAGGIEKDRKDNNRLFPVIRFDEHNTDLRLVTRFTFDYHKEEQITNRVCVKLTTKTIAVLPNLFQAQLRWFTDEYGNI
jgi:hypothetical protein